jgi:hypothetical protein
MKTFITTLICIIGLVTIAKADMIDYWHVYYNDVKINEFNEYSHVYSGKPNEIRLKIKDIKETDSLSIIYFFDYCCSQNSTTIVKIENEGRFVITKGIGNGSQNPIKVSVFDLLLRSGYAENEEPLPFFAYFYEYDYFYFEAYNDYVEFVAAERVLLFKINLE